VLSTGSTAAPRGKMCVVVRWGVSARTNIVLNNAIIGE